MEPISKFSADDEHIVRTFSTHWVKYSLPIIIVAIVGSAGAFILFSAAMTSESNPWVSILFLFAGLIVLYLAHHWFFHRILGEAMEDIIITNHRIIWIVESLYRIDEQRQIPLDKIQGVEAVKMGVFQNVLGYGSIWFDTGGTTTHDANAMINQVPHPNRIARDINQLLGLN